MNILEQYNSLDDKKEAFQSNIINTVNQFENFYNQVSNDEDHLFRGVNESKYKLYNSAQRSWITHELKLKGTYKDFINSIILNARKGQKNLLEKMFKGFKSKPDDLAILSFLQHHSAPTPLLDFTSNLDVALYFAASSSKIYETQKNIEKYFSIYMLDKNNLFDYSDSVHKVKENISNRKNVLQADLDNLNTFGFSLNQMFRMPVSYIDNKNDSLVNNNFNIINQDGKFVMNNDSSIPLENVFVNMNKEIIQEKGENYDEFRKEKEIRLMGSAEIHKSLYKYVLKKVRANGISNEYLFPDPYLIAKKAFYEYLEK